MAQETAKPRVAPQQARSRQRVNKILDKAAHLFALNGYEPVTTNQIAAAASVPIGSVYEFFPNKQAILQALVERYYAELHEFYATLFTASAFEQPLNQLLEAMLNGLIKLHQNYPALNTLLYGSYTSPDLAASAEQLQAELYQGVGSALAQYFPALDPARRKIMVELSVEVVKTFLPMLTRTNLTSAELNQRVNEVKLMLYAYYNTSSEK